MSVNKHAPHVLVLPEDKANRQIVNGFQLALPFRNIRSMQILPEAGGWARVRDSFLDDHVPDMERRPGRYMILLIDFDGNTGRLQSVKGSIPQHLGDRVFVLGALTQPEELRNDGLGKFEEIGALLARDCCERTDATWQHRLLMHNAPEVERMSAALYPILFGPT